MLSQLQPYLTFENIFIITNIIVVPFWLMLIFIPNSRFTQILVNSIIVPLLFGAVYCYVIYEIILLEEEILEIFKIYLSLDNLYTLFAIESFLLIFWLHFVALNLFLGSWTSRDAFKNSISRKLVFIPLILIYISGPVGLVIYWIIRMLVARKISLHD